MVGQSYFARQCTDCGALVAPLYDVFARELRSLEYVSCETRATGTGQVEMKVIVKTHRCPRRD